MKRPLVSIRLASRNLRRQSRRTLLTSAAMILGGALLVFSLSIGDGTHEDWIESAVRMGPGHVSIQAPGFRATRKLEDRLGARTRRAAEEALRTFRATAHVVDSAPRLSTGGLASSPAGARPAQITGVDPVAETAFSVLDEKIVEGRYLRADDRLAAVVGAGLVESLDLGIGSKFVLTAQSGDGEIASQLVRVVGIFRTGIPEIDQGLIQMPLATARSWLATGDDVTSIALLVDSSRRVPRVVRALERALSEEIGEGTVAVLSWRESMPELDAAVRIDDLGNYVWQGMVFGIIALGIVNTVLMSVMYRKREFGLLQALGLTRGETGALVMIEGLILTLTSGAIGTGLGLLVTWSFWRDGIDFSAMWSEEWTFSGVVMDPVIVPLFTTARIAQTLLFILAIGLLASSYPAYRATRVDLAGAMKFDR